MSFSWRGLLGVGGLTNVSSSSTNAGPSDPYERASALFDEQELPWQLLNDGSIPNMLGMRNFGNTCYVNSVIQALYFCRPFRESLLAYSAALAAIKAKEIQAEAKTAPSAETKAVETTTSTQQQLVEASFYDALRLLFSQMVTSTVKAPVVEANAAPSSSSSNSILGSGLSRKNSVKPSTGKATLGLSSPSSLPSIMLAPSITSILPPSLASTTPANKAINSCSNIIVPDDDIRKFLATLKKSNALFDTTTHQDAHELLNFVLNRIGEDVFEEAKADGRTNHHSEGAVSVVDVNSKGQTWVHRVFEGILTNETRCLTCETVTSRDECFLDLSIDIERNASVTACLRQFSASEMLYARNKFFCDTCSSLQEAEKRMKVKKLPNVLALHLKRFKYEEALQRFVKLAYRVVFPFELRLFNTSDDAQDPDRLYELFAIIVHIGVGPHHGHYITIVKVASRWFVFDDETINIIDEADICRYYGDTPGAGSAYVLFYQAAELNLQDLGLTDTQAEKQRAREKAEAILWDHFQSQQKQHNDPPPLKVDMTRLPSSLTSPIQASPTTSDVMANEYRSSGMSPSVSSSGITASGLFSRKPAMPHSPITLTSPNGSDAPTESKSSWFSSLRSGGSARKSSVNASSALNPPINSHSGTSPPSAFKPIIASDRGEDVETASISTSSSSRRGPREGLAHKMAMNDGLLSTSAKAAPCTSPTSDLNQAGPAEMPDAPFNAHERAVSQGGSTAGAAWAPADRPLSKKEQEKIARQSRRSSVSASISNATPSNGKDASETGSESNGFLSSRKPSIRRPVTAEPVPIIDGQPSFASRRRTTLSRAFGLGRKTDKQ